MDMEIVGRASGREWDSEGECPDCGDLKDGLCRECACCPDCDPCFCDKTIRWQDVKLEDGTALEDRLDLAKELRDTKGILGHFLARVGWHEERDDDASTWGPPLSAIDFSDLDLWIDDAHDRKAAR